MMGAGRSCLAWGLTGACALNHVESCAFNWGFEPNHSGNSGFLKVNVAKIRMQKN